MQEFGYTPEQVGRMSWTQVKAISQGVGELKKAMKPDPDRDPKELAADPDYQRRVAEAINRCKNPDGTVDLFKASRLLGA